MDDLEEGAVEKEEMQEPYTIDFRGEQQCYMNTTYFQTSAFSVMNSSCCVTASI